MKNSSPDLLFLSLFYPVSAIMVWRLWKIPAFFVCLSQLRRNVKVCKPSIWTLAEFRADCNLIYLLFAWLSLEFLEFFNWIVSQRELEVGEALVTQSPFHLCLIDRGQVIKLRVWELCSNFEFNTSFWNHSRRFLLGLVIFFSCWWDHQNLFWTVLFSLQVYLKYLDFP